MMALTPSNMLPLGTVAPSFTLPDTRSGKMISLSDIKSDQATLVMFICNHCPFVLHVIDEVVSVAKEYQSKGVSFVAISSNDVHQYEQDSPDKMKDFAHEHGFTFPYLYDESQDVAKAYKAACTPDFYIFDRNLQCVYRGQFDESRPGNEKPVTGEDVRAALDQLLAGQPITVKQKPSMGCNIKWK